MLETSKLATISRMDIQETMNKLFISNDGTRVWKLPKHLYRIGGPVLEYQDGYKRWETDDGLHRKYWPACEGGTYSTLYVYGKAYHNNTIFKMICELDNIRYLFGTNTIGSILERSLRSFLCDLDSILCTLSTILER